MKLVDANVLLYADNEDAEHHEASHQWLTGALSGVETLIVPWLNVVSDLRVSTNPAYHREPNSLAQSFDSIETVLSAPPVIPGEPNGAHLSRMSDLLAVTGRGGNLVSDAHLAALALQYDATVISFETTSAGSPASGGNARRPCELTLFHARR